MVTGSSERYVHETRFATFGVAREHVRDKATGNISNRWACRAGHGHGTTPCITRKMKEKFYAKKKLLSPGMAHSRVQAHADRVRLLTDVSVSNFINKVKIHKDIYRDSVQYPSFLYKNFNVSKIGSASDFK
jgi:hypothetical protein